MAVQKVAVTTEDGDRIGMHFGKTPYFLIATLEDGSITNRELRPNTFTTHMQGGHNGHSHDAGGHSCGPRIVEGLADCHILICGGIGQGAINALQRAGLQIIATRYPTVDQTLDAFLSGALTDDAEACKDHKH